MPTRVIWGALLFFIFISASNAQAQGSEKSSTKATPEKVLDAATAEDLNRQAQVREKFLLLTNQFRSQMVGEVEKRIAHGGTNFRLDSLQTDFVGEFTLRVRLDVGLSRVRPREVDIWVDGIPQGSFPFSQTNEEADYPIRWFDFKLNRVPSGERLLRFSLKCDMDRSLMSSGTLHSEMLTLDSFASVFVTGTKGKDNQEPAILQLTVVSAAPGEGLRLESKTSQGDMP